jgi:hypothetical protein
MAIVKEEYVSWAINFFNTPRQNSRGETLKFEALWHATVFRVVLELVRAFFEPLKVCTTGTRRTFSNAIKKLLLIVRSLNRIPKFIRPYPVAYVPYKNYFLAVWSFHFQCVQNAGGCSDGSWPSDGGGRFPPPDA